MERPHAADGAARIRNSLITPLLACASPLGGLGLAVGSAIGPEDKRAWLTLAGGRIALNIVGIRCSRQAPAIGWDTEHRLTPACHVERPMMPRVRVVWWLAVASVSLSTVAACERRAGSPKPDAVGSASLMTPAELSGLPSSPPDLRAAYGPDSSEYGELRMPAGPGPHPVVVLVHGGCFKAAYATVRDLSAMADALRADGIATWNVEYRRLGQPGGGWPGTYLDVGHAVDYLRVLAPEHALDLHRVVLVGHSAGGHLAMWAAARARVPAGSAIHIPHPLPVRGVLDLAGPLDLTANIAGYEGLCGDTVITGLLGGTPEAVPDRYADASPMHLLPAAVPQVVVIGEYEQFVPRPLVEAYVQAARQAGDSVRLVVASKAGHFEIASPRASPWAQVRTAIRGLLNGRLPPPGVPITATPAQ